MDALRPAHGCWVLHSSWLPPEYEHTLVHHDEQRRRVRREIDRAHPTALSPKRGSRPILASSDSKYPRRSYSDERRIEQYRARVRRV